MEKKRNNLLKRVAAGALSVLTVAAYSLPANVGGIFSGNIGIVAQAAGETISVDNISEGDILTSGTTISSAGYDDRYIDVYDGENQDYSFDEEYTLQSDCFVRYFESDTEIDEETNEEYKSIYVLFYAIREANTFVENNGVYTSNIQGQQDTVAYYSFVSDSAQTMNWLVDSEGNSDILYVYVNDVKEVEASGGNVSGSLELAAGDNVRVIYLKDGSIDMGSDCASFSLTGNVLGYINNGDGTHSIAGDEAKEAHHFTDGYTVTPVDSTSGFTESYAFPGSWKNNNSRLENNTKDGTTARKSWNVTVPEGQKLYIYYLISSESGCDYLNIYDYNDPLREYISGETEGFIELAAGEHSITAEYKKDGSGAYGMDSAYIRFVPECTECGANDSTMKSLLTFDAGIYTDIAVTGTGTSKVQSNTYGVNSMYWCQDTATIYSNVGLYTDNSKASLQKEEGLFTYGGNQYFFKYTLTVVDPSVGKNIPIWKSGIDEDYSTFDVVNNNWTYDEEYNMYFTTYDGKIPDISEFTITPSSNIDNEDEIASIQAILDSPDTVKKLIWNSPGVYCGAPCEGIVVIYNPEIGVKAKHVEIKFEKRKVTVTPKAGQSKVYGDDKLPEIECDIEQENGDRGILAIDIDKNITPKFYAWDSDHSYRADYRDVNVGEYYYEIDNEYDDDGEGFESGRWNYEFELAENCPTFAVVPKDISGYTLDIGYNRWDVYDQVGGYWVHDPEVPYRSDFYDVVNDGGVIFLENGKKVNLEEEYIEYGGDVKKHSVGDYTLHVWGKGNYTGHISANWSIVRESGDIIQYNGSKTYDGKDISDMFEIYDPNNEYEVRYSNDNGYIDELSPDVGTYYVETWKGDERKDSKSFSIYTKHLRSSDIEFDFGDTTTIMTSADEWLEFPVEQISIFDKTANKQLELGEEYNGYAWDDDGNEIQVSFAKDYYVMPVKTKAPGVYKIEIVGKGNYKGYITTDWTVMREAVSVIESAKTYDTQGRVTFTVRNEYNGEGDVSYGVLIKRGLAAGTELTADNAEFDSALASAYTTFRTKDQGAGITVRPYMIVDGVRMLGEQYTVKYADLQAEEANAATSVIESAKTYDTQGRVTFTVRNTYNGTQEASYGVLIKRGLAAGTELTADNAEFDSALASAYTTFRTKDQGAGITVRPYIVIGGVTKLGEQYTVKYSDLQAAEADAATSVIESAVKYDDAGRVTFTVRNTYNGTQEVSYGVLIKRGLAAGTELTADNAEFDSQLASAYTTFRTKDQGAGITVRPYIVINGVTKLGEQYTVKYSEL